MSMKFGRKSSLKQSQSIINLIDLVLFVICICICSVWVLVATFHSNSFQENILLLEPVWEIMIWLDIRIWSALWWAWILGSNLISNNNLSIATWNKSWKEDWIQAIQSVLEWIQLITSNTFLKNITTIHRNTFEDLFWKYWPQTYLILLQNTNEIRPNGWFFGSYGLLTVEWWFITELEFRDSYLPWFDRPWVWIQWPSWLLNMMPTNEIHFVWANKIGFTYADGWHIQRLHELAYSHEKIRWVVFLRLDTLLQVLPQLEESIIRWQFINAMADKLPRDDWKKKSLYLSELEKTVGNAATQFLKKLIASRHEFPNNYMDVYLEDIPWGFHTFLRNNALTTRFDDEALYAWDSNTSYSKTDGFVGREVVCKPINCLWEECTIVVFDEILNSWVLNNWAARQCKKTYDFEIPQEYKNQIHELEKEYWVLLEEREEHILWIDPVRWNRWIIYLWDQRKISWLTWQIDEWNIFKTPFGQAMSYQVWMQWDQQSRVVGWDMTRRKK